MASFERSLMAMARGDWDQAEAFADQASSAFRRAGGGDSYATRLVCAAQARAALHRADLSAVRQHLVTAQRTRPC